MSGRKTAVADHYIYFGDTRNYDEIEDPEQRALQREYDELVNDFMARLILASKNETERTRFFINGSIQSLVVPYNYLTILSVYSPLTPSNIHRIIELWHHVQRNIQKQPLKRRTPQ